MLIVEYLLQRHPLVDGEMLTNLMIQYKVGVQIRQVYELYDIDDDFFKE